MAVDKYRHQHQASSMKALSARLKSQVKASKVRALKKVAAFEKLRSKNILNPPGGKEKLTVKCLIVAGRRA
jgi:hypothetical protein